MAIAPEVQAAMDRMASKRGDGEDVSHNSEDDELILLAAIAEKLGT